MSANVPDMAGKVMTVRGPIDPDELGPTLMHEHLFIALYKGVAPDDYTPATDWCLWDQELTIDKLDLARDLKPIRDNWILVDEKTAIDEAMEFRHHGGGTIVEVTSIGLRRDPLAISRVSQATGLNVVMGAGWYQKLYSSGRHGPADRRGHDRRRLSGTLRWALAGPPSGRGSSEKWESKATRLRKTRSRAYGPRAGPAAPPAPPFPSTGAESAGRGWR